MTQPPTYTAYIRFPLSTVPTTTDTTGTYLVECPELDDNRGKVAMQMLSAQSWLDARELLHHHVKTYDNSCHASGTGEIAIVLNDRDTALMLKLAVQP